MKPRGARKPRELSGAPDWGEDGEQCHGCFWLNSGVMLGERVVVRDGTGMDFRARTPPVPAQPQQSPPKPTLPGQPPGTEMMLGSLWPGFAPRSWLCLQ